MAIDAPIQHQVGVALLYHDSLHSQVEAHNHLPPNVSIFQMSSGVNLCGVVGCYVAPTGLETIKQVIKEND